MMAFADRVDSSSQSWAESLRTLQRAGRTPVTSVIYDEVRKINLGVDVQTLDIFKKIADEQTMIWADTILEGDFVIANPTTLEKIEAVWFGKTFVGFRITYSSEAWEVSECDSQKYRTSNSCLHGKIRESSFVNSGLSAWIRDETAYAMFL